LIEFLKIRIFLIFDSQFSPYFIKKKLKYEKYDDKLIGKYKYQIVLQ